jgi:lipid A ethanolaminephosphotransferase
VSIPSTLRLRAYYLPFVAALFMVAGFNQSFWSRFIIAIGGVAVSKIPLLIATFIFLVLVFGTVLSLLNFRPVIKPTLIFLLVVTAGVSHFMNQYGIQIDKSMVQNVIETDTREARELLSWQMACAIVLFGVLPSFILARTQVVYDKAWRHLLMTGAIGAAALAVAVVILFAFFKSYAPAFREHRELRFLLTPSNYIQAVNGYVQQKFSKPLTIAALGRDAAKGAEWAGQHKRVVTVIVMGETARAMNFSLNHYGRQTNPFLEHQEGLINFSNVQSCGTATAVSLPCVFSVLGHEKYSDSKARSQEGLLDVFSHAGFSVLWRNNNSGCKGVCDRVTYEDLSLPVAGNPLCNAEECFDERLLENLPEIIRKSDKDMVIVLHQKGSHGPSYWKRYPPEFQRFGPVCQTNDLEQCSREQITAAYDNTILYTDYLLHKTIQMLEQVSADDNADTSMLYFSDHGESLGEKNMYLHGAPYIISPPEQRQVPMMLWLSPGFSERFKIDRHCLAARADQPFSHDNVFHSLLGLLDVHTVVYNPKLDLFQPCNRPT